MSDKTPSTPAAAQDGCPFCRKPRWAHDFDGRSDTCYDREIAALKTERDKALADYFETSQRLETYFEERPVKLRVRICGHEIYIDHKATPETCTKVAGDILEGTRARLGREAKEGGTDEPDED